MYIKSVTLKNIRCFENLRIEYDIKGKNIPFSLVLGDNSTGKTTLIKSIALGLCDESSAASLMKEADAGYIRKGKKWGSITIELQRKNGRTNYYIKTTIIKERNWEKLRQDVRPEKSFPWNELFVCGYGAGRGTSGTGDVVGYSVLNAVYNLFNYSEGLQNPELSLLRIENESARNLFFHTLNELLDTNKISYDKKGIFIDGTWGHIPLRDLADGYKSSFLWVTDFLGWVISKNPDISDTRNITGIVLIDEIEQHLHPKWQQQVVKRLKNQFPLVQFIVTTHSPLISASVGPIYEDVDMDKIIRLKLFPGNKVSAERIPSMTGWRADQVLASKAFEYTVTMRDEINEILREASVLMGKKDRLEPSEEKRYQSLKKKIGKLLLSNYETPIEREVERELDNKIQKQIVNLEKKLLGDLYDKD